MVPGDLNRYQIKTTRNNHGLLLTFGGKMADTKENWFDQRNKYQYLDLMMIMSKADVTSVKAVHEKLKRAGKWVDVRHFVKKHKHYNPSGLFEVFGSLSNQEADDVRDCLIGWILDNYRQVQLWLRAALEHKNLTLDTWMENMRDTLTHGDDITLYLLCRMYDKHVYVHTARVGWSTLPMKVNEDLTALLPKCDMELVLLDQWSFGEVHKIRKPQLPAITSKKTDVITENVSGTMDPVITGNVTPTAPCKVRVTRITSITTNPKRCAQGNSGYDMRSRPPPQKVTHRTSGRKRKKVDYSQYDLTDDPPTPPKRKRKLDLKRKPSAGRIAAEKYKTKPANTPRPVRKPVPVHVPTTTSINTDPHPTAVASTSKTLTTPATQEETISVLQELASMDIVPDDDPNDNDGLTLPIPTNAIQQPEAEPNTKKEPETDTKPMMLPRIIGTAIKIENTTYRPPQKKVFKTVEYKLKRKYTKQRNFLCTVCNSRFEKQKYLNEHFRTLHPAVKCDMCDKCFDTPAAMLRHKYKHFDFMCECEICGRGFQFTSQLLEHKRVHQVQGNWVCFRPKCGKRFKRESDLNAHLVSHGKKEYACDKCPYKNTDPRNLRAHKRRHSDVLPFKCMTCGKGFKWIQQRIRHVKSGNCP